MFINLFKYNALQQVEKLKKEILSPEQTVCVVTAVWTVSGPGLGFVSKQNENYK